MRCHRNWHERARRQSPTVIPAAAKRRAGTQEPSPVTWVYTIELEDTVYVLHCFQKKSKSGITTPQADIDLIERRLKEARTLHAQRQRKTP